VEIHCEDKIIYAKFLFPHQALSPEQTELLHHNFREIERDPVTVAAVAAMVHLKDKFSWGILPPSCWSEIMGTYAVQIACAISGDYVRMADYRQRLTPIRADNHTLINLACRSLALGFANKWNAL